MDLLDRTHELTVDAGRPAAREPWQTRFSSLPSVPTSGAQRPVPPIAIPVMGGQPIAGRRLVRAPWAEPLAAFAGVIVETRLVPDAWLTPRSAARRVMDGPLTAVQPSAVTAPGGGSRPSAAIPIGNERGPVPVRVAPGSASAPARSHAMPAAAVVSALGLPHAAVSTTSAAPIEPVVPSPEPSTPAPARRGLLGRAVVLAAGLVMSLVAVEAAARLGRR